MARTINIFLASSDELINDRNSFHSFIATLDDIYESRGIRVKLKRWEDFSAYCTGERTQDDYNKVVRASDMCIAMFHRKAGKFTVEEFHQALDEYKTNKVHPKTYVYARVLMEGETEEQELVDFKKELFEKMGHYWCNYATDDSMKLHFVMQFERYVTPDLMERSVNSNLSVENGIIKLHNREIARYENLPFAYNNEQYNRLKEDIARDDTEIIQLRSIGNAALHPMINEKVNARNEKRKILEETERNLFNTALYISRLQGDDKTMSERKRRAIELFEQGKNREAAAVLNEDEIAEDARRASDKILQGKALMEVGNELYEKGVSEIRSLIEEYVLRATSLMNDTSNDERLKLSCDSYEEAIILAEAYLDKIEYADLMNDYGNFLYNNRQYHLVKEWYVKTIGVYIDVFESKIMSPVKMIFPLWHLGKNYYRLLNYEAAKRAYESVYNIFVDIIQDIQSEHIECVYEDSDLKVLKKIFVPLIDDYCQLLIVMKKYEDALSLYKILKTYNDNESIKINGNEEDSLLISLGFGKVYMALNDFQNSEIFLLESLDIVRSLCVKNLSSKEVYSDVLYLLGTLYIRIFKYSIGESFLKECYAIRQQLYNIDSKKYLSGLAEVLSALSLALYYNEDYGKAEITVLEALSFFRQLEIVNSETHTIKLVESLAHLGIIQTALGKFIEAEESLNEALILIKQKSESCNYLFDDCLASVLVDLGLLYSTMGEYTKSISFFEEGLLMYRKLNELVPGTNIDFMASVSSNLGDVYRILGDLDLAKNRYCEASVLLKTMYTTNENIYEALLEILFKQGEIYCELKDLESEEKVYAEAFQICKNKENPELLADIMNNWGIVYCKNQKYDLAKEKYDRALNSYNQIKDFNIDVYVKIACVLYNQGIVYNEMGDYESAKEQYNKALDIYRKMEKNTPGKYQDKINSICEELYNNQIVCKLE